MSRAENQNPWISRLTGQMDIRFPVEQDALCKNPLVGKYRCEWSSQRL